MLAVLLDMSPDTWQETVMQSVVVLAVAYVLGRLLIAMAMENAR